MNSDSSLFSTNLPLRPISMTFLSSVENHSSSILTMKSYELFDFNFFLHARTVALIQNDFSGKISGFGILGHVEIISQKCQNSTNFAALPSSDLHFSHFFSSRYDMGIFPSNFHHERRKRLHDSNQY